VGAPNWPISVDVPKARYFAISYPGWLKCHQKGKQKSAGNNPVGRNRSAVAALQIGSWCFKAIKQKQNALERLRGEKMRFDDLRQLIKYDDIKLLMIYRC